jgi:hypothetical protein
MSEKKSPKRCCDAVTSVLRNVFQSTKAETVQVAELAFKDLVSGKTLEEIEADVAKKVAEDASEISKKCAESVLCCLNDKKDL